MNTDHIVFLIGNGCIGLFLLVGAFIFVKYVFPRMASNSMKANVHESKTRLEEAQLQIQARSEERDRMFTLMSKQMDADREERRLDRQNQHIQDERNMQAFSKAIQDSIEGCDQRTEKLARAFTDALEKQTRIIGKELVAFSKSHIEDKHGERT